MKKRKSRVRSESRFLNGIEFRRYPDAKNWSDRVYYRPNGTHAKKGVRAYHRELWIIHNGPIPDGFDVHHKDNNPDNNDISNLELQKTIGGHQGLHGDATKTPEYLEIRRKSISKAVVSAREWHLSEEGQEWHRTEGVRHGKESWIDKPTFPVSCKVCGKTFKTPFPSFAKFCSETCKSKCARLSPTRITVRTCICCGVSFETNKYGKVKSCSMSCAAKMRQRDAKGRMRRK